MPSSRMWPRLRRTPVQSLWAFYGSAGLEQVIWLLVFSLRERASLQFPRDIMGMKLVTDQPKLLISGVLFSFSRNVCWYVGLGF